MKLSFYETLAIIFVTAACTFLTRLLPFAIFGKRKQLPKSVAYLGGVLPSAMIATLVVYCIRNVSLFSGSHGLPELLSIALVVLLHLWKKNTLLSIGFGTLFYMLCIQYLF